MKCHRNKSYFPRFGPLLMIFWVLASYRIFAQAPVGVKPGTTFASKDIFGTAVFHDNNDIISDYNGEKIIYYTNHDYVNACFTEKGIIYLVQEVAKEGEIPGKKDRDNDDNEKELKRGKDEKEKEGIPTKVSAVCMNWIGANPHPEIISADKQTNYYTYLRKEGNSYKTLITSGYKTITYKNLYPGIDVVYTFPEKGGMKYNLLVHPGADARTVKMAYTGNLKGLEQDKDGNIIVQTYSGDIVEHAPVSLTDNAKPVNSSFALEGNTIQFNFPEGYNTNLPLVIDPWVTVLTSLPPVNLGFNVDYDNSGNLFVYGAGAYTPQDTAHYFQVAKYSPTGVLLWTFNGSVPVINWTTMMIPWDNDITTLSEGISYPGGLTIDKVSGKAYVGQGVGFDPGTLTIRLNPAGAYDNFVTQGDSSFIECWGYEFDCSNGSILALGGGPTSDINMGVINTTSGAVSRSNITGETALNNVNPMDYKYQDIAGGAFDAAGNLYVVFSFTSFQIYDAGYNGSQNMIYRLNSSYNGYVWQTYTGFSALHELCNAPFWASDWSMQANIYGYYSSQVPNDNWTNVLAANGSYLYYYDGENLAAYSLANGAVVGTPYKIMGYDSLYQDGIAVDNCNHVYVGGKGVIKTFTFNGSTFTPGADISLGAGFENDTVHDVRYDATNNLLYVAGGGFVGTYTATLTSNCTTVYTTHTCNTATAHIIAQQNIAPPTFTYTWTNTSGTVIGQTTTTDTVNTITGLSNGTYYVQVQWNVNCGGSVINDTVTISGANTTVAVNNVTICAGGSATLTATPSATGGTYVWVPGGYTTNTISVSPGVTTVYTVQYTVGCGTISSTGTVTVGPPNTITVNNATVCIHDSATLTAVPAMAGGTFSWSPGGYTTNTIRVAPASTTTYTVQYTSACGTVTGTGTVTVFTQPATISINSPGVCPGQSATLTATPSLPGGTYSWSPGGYTTNAINVTPSATTAYTVVYTTGCGTPTATSTVTVFPAPPVLSVTTSPPSCTNPNGGSITVVTTGGVSPFQYAVNGGAEQTSDIFNNLGVGNYTFVVTDANGCKSASSASLAAPVNPTLQLTADNTCTNTSAGVITASATGGEGPYQFAINSGAFQASGSFTNLAAGNYSVTVNDAQGCTGVNSIAVDTLFTPTATFTVSPQVCIGQNATVTYTGDGGANSTYNWNFDGGSASPASGQGPLYVNWLIPGTKNITLTVNQAGCANTFTDSVVVFSSPPHPKLSADTVLGCQNLKVCFTSTSVGNAISYTWNFGDGETAETQDACNTYAEPGVYTVAFRVALSPECVYDTTLSDLITVITDPVAAFTPNITVIQQPQSLISFTNQSTNAITYLWDFATAGVSNEIAGSSTTTNTQFSFTQYGLYNVTLYAYNRLGCADSTTHEITVLPPQNFYIPNAFTPNGDGNNDVFIPLLQEGATLMSFQVYDRWGEKVHDGLYPWDGTYKGQPAPEAVYVYRANIHLVDESIDIERKGSVTLIR